MEDLVPASVVVLFPSELATVTPADVSLVLGAMFSGAVVVVAAIRFTISVLRDVAG